MNEKSSYSAHQSSTKAAAPKLASPRTVSIVGAGYKGGQPISGCEKGPAEIRKYLNVSTAKELGWNVEDVGDLAFEAFSDDKPAANGVKNPRNVGNACRTIYETLSKQSKDKKLCLTLGGDHSLAIGSVAGVHAGHEDLAIIWIDAHADINTPETSPSGNIHGMPLAFLLGLVKSDTIPGFEWLKPCLSPDRIVFVGLRDVDAGERRILKEQGIKAFSMTEVDQLGIVKVMEQALDHVDPNKNRPIHLSFDVDGIDPTIVPSTGTRVKGGLTFREARYICETVAATTRLVGLDVVEVNPDIGSPDDAKATAEVAVEIINFALGAKLL